MWSCRNVTGWLVGGVRGDDERHGRRKYCRKGNSWRSEPVLGSSLASFRWLIISVICFTVPFLYFISEKHKIHAEAWLLRGAAWKRAYILKFPPTKNCRVMIAV